MHKLILTAAVGALALTGCDFSESAGPATPVSISSIEVSNLQDRAWDEGSNPDVFVEIRNLAGRAYYRSAPIQNADVSGTLTFTIDETVEVGPPTAPLIVGVFDMDEDLVHSDVMGYTTSFTAAELAAGNVERAAGNASVVLRSSASTIGADL